MLNHFLRPLKKDYEQNRIGDDAYCINITHERQNILTLKLWGMLMTIGDEMQITKNNNIKTR